MNTTATRARRSLLVAGALASPLWLGAALAAPAHAAPAAPAAPAASVSPSPQQPSTAGSPEPAETTDSSQFVPLVVEPALAYLETTVTGYVKDTEGTYYGPYELKSRCSAFTVGSDGDLLTAGHCVDVAPGSDLWMQLVDAAVQDAMVVGYTWEDTGVALTAEELAEVVAAQWSVEGDQSGSAPIVQVGVQLHGEGDLLPASVREVAGVGDGDTALLKVNATGLPVLELATDRVAVGEDVISVGYAAVSDQVSDPSASPTFRGGEVTSNNRTQEGGKLPVYETSADLTGGMSGGPTVDEQGRVIGINSYHATGSAAFNYVQPSTIALDLLPRSVDNELSPADVRFREGAAALVADRPAEALAAFEEVLDVVPGYATATGLRDQAAKAVADQPAPVVGEGAELDSAEVSAQTEAARSEVDGSTSIVDVVRSAAMLVLTLAMSAAAIVLARRRRALRAQQVQAPASAQPSSGAQPPAFAQAPAAPVDVRSDQLR